MPLRFRVLAAVPGNPPGTATAALASNAPSTEESLGPRSETRFEAPSQPSELFVGRRADAELSLPFASVSARHARLFRGDTEREWWLEDLGSVNGTWVDDVRAVPGRVVPLRAGQRLRMGTVDLLFDGWSATAEGDEGTGTLARRLISDLFSSPDSEVPTLTVHDGPVRVEPLRLTQRDRRYLAGRAETCELVLASEHVSREHAAFVRRRDGVFVQDLGSRNTVRVNGVSIEGEARLSDGDRIEVGAVILSLADPEERYRARLQRLGAQPSPPGLAAAAGARPARSGTPTVGLPIEIASEAQGGTGPEVAVRTPEQRTPLKPRRASGATHTVSPGAGPRRRIAPIIALVAAGGVVVLAVAGLIILLVTGV